MYKIDTNFPRYKGKSAEIRYPFIEMDMNDSFLIPKSDFTKTSTIRADVYNQLNKFNKVFKKDYAVSIFKTPEGLRVWRIK